MRTVVTVLTASILSMPTAAWASECRGNPDALGTSRTLAIAPADYGRIGFMQYKTTLPLAEGEVVLTFDDGPIRPHTTRILQTLASNCVKATFFIVGRQARAFPDIVRRIRELGHTIATHSQNHPFRFAELPVSRLSEEVEGGIAAIAAALGDRAEVAPFFRIPGLSRSNRNETYLASRGLSVWSADFVADDWRHISAQKVVERALSRIAQKGKGVLLLHDIQPATALALPRLLHELKARGYRIVHVVPSEAIRPKPQPDSVPDQIVRDMPVRRTWPPAVEAAALQPPHVRPEDLLWPKRFTMTYAAQPTEVRMIAPLDAWASQDENASDWRKFIERANADSADPAAAADPANFGFAHASAGIAPAPSPEIAHGLAPAEQKPVEMVYPIFALEPLLKVRSVQSH